MKEFKKTDKTKITRKPNRGTYDKETIYGILDDGLFCTVAYVHEGMPFQIPTGFCRINDTLYIHGSVGSFYMRTLVQEQPLVSVGVTHIDGLVLARSAMHHSVNYRSVVVFGKPSKVENADEIYRVLEVFTNKMQPGRWNDIRQPSESEWKKTLVVAISMEEASAKIRTGPPIDDEEDHSLSVWAGVVPLHITRGVPIADETLDKDIKLPTYLT